MAGRQQVPRAARATLPSAALRSKFQKQLETFIAEMDNSLCHWLLARYREYEPVIVPAIAADAKLPAHALQEVLQKRLGQWIAAMNLRADDLAKNIVKGTDRHVKNSLAHALRDAAGVGVGVHLRMTRDVQNVLNSLIYEQASLIRSIPEYYAREVEGLVMRAVRDGRNAGFLQHEMKKRYYLTKRRARIIARDQTNKATESLTRTRAASLGITEGIWMHRGGSRNPRISHLAMHGQRFTLSEGCYNAEEGRNIRPGELINCNCTFKPILPSW